MILAQGQDDPRVSADPTFSCRQGQPLKREVSIGRREGGTSGGRRETSAREKEAEKKREVAVVEKKREGSSSSLTRGGSSSSLVRREGTTSSSSNSLSRRDGSSSRRDPSPGGANRACVRNGPGDKRDPSPGSGATARVQTGRRDPSPSTGRTTTSKRDASPSVSRPRLASRTASPNRSGTNIRTGQPQRTLSSSRPGIQTSRNSTNNTSTGSRPSSRSSSFTRADLKASPVVRSGLATLPRDTQGRSRSSGDYVTVLEIQVVTSQPHLHHSPSSPHNLQGGEARSRSAGVRGKAHTTERKPRTGPGRTSSLKRAGVGRGGSFKEENAAGTVSVHVKQVCEDCLRYFELCNNDLISSLRHLQRLVRGSLLGSSRSRSDLGKITTIISSQV